MVASKGSENKPYIAAMRGLRSSSAATPHADRRTRNERTRQAAVRASVKRSREDGYTIMELTVAIIIISILAAFAAFNALKSTDTVDVTTVSVDVNNAYTSLALDAAYANETRTYRIGTPSASCPEANDPKTFENIAIIGEQTCITVEQTPLSLTVTGTNPEFDGSVKYDNVTNHFTKTGSYK